MIMDNSQLAALMLQWEQVQRQADALRAQIETAVLAQGKTQTVGNVRATFSAGRKTYDYKAAVDSKGYGPVELMQWQKVSFDYKAACEAYGLEAPLTQAEPSVTVKLL